MINRVKIKKESEINKIVSKTCDKCGTTYNAEDEIFECQEFHHINFTGGYGSVFGDSETIECDLCQHCLKDLISSFFRYTSAIYD